MLDGGEVTLGAGLFQLIEYGQGQVRRGDPRRTVVVDQKRVTASAISAGSLSGLEDCRRTQVGPVLVRMFCTRVELVEAGRCDVTPLGRHEGGVVQDAQLPIVR